MLKNTEWTVNTIIAAYLNPNLSIVDVIPEWLKDLADVALNYILNNIPAAQLINPNSGFGARPIYAHKNEFEAFKQSSYFGEIPIDEFWKSHSIDLPNLYKIAKRYFGLYPSSSCIERA